MFEDRTFLTQIAHLLHVVFARLFCMPFCSFPVFPAVTHINSMLHMGSYSEVLIPPRVRAYVDLHVRDYCDQAQREAGGDPAVVWEMC